MDTPIINPWVVYAISVFGATKQAALLLNVLLLTLGLIAGIACMMENQVEVFIKGIKCIGKIAFGLTLLYVLIPSEEAMYKMLILSYITPENVGMATDVIKSVGEYVKELIK